MSDLDRAFIKAYGMDERNDDETHSERSPLPSVIPAPHGNFFSPAAVPSQIVTDVAATDSASDLLKDSKIFSLHESHASDSAGTDSDSAGTDIASEAAFQVERFAWPQVCDQLLADAPELFEPLIGEFGSAARPACRSIAVTSCRRGEGRTNLVLCLARSAARAGIRTVMVDADIHRPELARRLGVLPELGWDEALAGELPLTEALIDSVEDQLALLPLSKKPKSLAPSIAENDSPSADVTVDMPSVDEAPSILQFDWPTPDTSSSDSLKTVPSADVDPDTLVAEPPAHSDDPIESSGLARVLDELRASFDLVLLDCGPVSFSDDPICMLSPESRALVDTAIFVEDVRSTCLDEVNAACRRLLSLDIPCAGIVENFVTDQ